ncbi:antitoxin VapB [Rhizomicrobium palustre]|uniref:Antitoxin VapB n=1 Tax=Rhizomicrobium palustre TaxID=189966 RepID=A0A846MVH0_9PROT|nr:AbrB/MazE/SpoVT family DNA-binding domain-containing protein [Rhizomicrobium palustre]NIK87060.1 antitoxin VapB [Rhizomicrobium palustre]
MNESRPVKLTRVGDDQIVEIPAEFALPGEEAILRKEGDKLIIETPRRKGSLKEWLSTLEPIEEEWPDIPDLPAEPVDL